MKFLCVTVSLFATQFCLAMNHSRPPKYNQDEMADLGMRLFNDRSLSDPPGQACISCHDPSAAFTSAVRTYPTSEGAVSNRFGSRNAPTLMYASYIPVFGKYPDSTGKLFLGGGLFLDGRADSLEEQAGGPMLNPIEMNNPNTDFVVQKVRAIYEKDFTSVYGSDVLADPLIAFSKIVEVIAAFERTEVFHPFSSKYDAYLQNKAALTSQELNGLKLFEDAKKANCVTCHSDQVDRNGNLPMFTNFTYDNIGVPKNPLNSFYQMASEFNPQGLDFVDEGLANHTGNVYHNGGFRIPTLRNIALTSPYMHNGYFQTLKGVIEFYNSRDVLPACPNPMTTESEALSLGCWPQAEEINAVDHDKMGKLGLTSEEVDDIIAFLNTLTDGWMQSGVLN